MRLADLLPAFDGDVAVVDVARRLLRDAIKEDRDMLLVPLIQWMRSEWRRPVRESEHCAADFDRARVRNEEGEPVGMSTDAGSRLSAMLSDPRFRRLLGQTVAVDGSGLRATWGALTVKQHIARHAMLTKHACDTMVTAQRHHETAELLIDVGADSLDEFFASTLVSV